jgi:hypothetical protein
MTGTAQLTKSKKTEMAIKRVRFLLDATHDPIEAPPLPHGREPQIS